MALSRKSTSHTSAAAVAGARLAEQLPSLLLNAFRDSQPPTASEASEQFGTALDELMTIDDKIGFAIDSAHGAICAEVQEEAFLAGFHAARTIALAFVRERA